MKKVTKMCLFGMAAAMILTGCSSAKNGSIKLGEYKGVEIGVHSYDVSQEELDDEIQSILEANPSYVEVDRAAQEGDTVNIDYVGKKDGVEFDGGASQGFDLELGSGTFIEGFEEGLVGHKAGEKVSLDLTFPEEYQSEDLAGAAVVFDVTINSVKERRGAVLDDTFVQGISEFKTVDEFTEDTKKDLVDYKKLSVDKQREYEALQAVVENSTIVCAQKDVDEQYKQQMDYYTNMAASFGLQMEDMVAAMGEDMDSFEEQLQTYAKQAVEQKMVVDAVAKKEKMKVTDDDRKALAEEYQTDMATLINQAGKENVDEAALTRKVAKFLAENAVEVEKETTVAETIQAEEATTAEETTAAAATTEETTAAQ